MQPVGVGPRIVAGIIDVVILIVVMVPLTLIAGQGLGTQLVISLIGIAYFIVMEATQGATIGKKVMGLKVVKKDGSAISWQESVIRNLLRIVDGLPAFYIVGIVCIALTPNKQRVGDMAANTLVVKK